MSTHNGDGVLLLGCGLVAPPMIEYFSQHAIKIVIASRTISKANPILERLTNSGVAANLLPLTEPYDIEADAKDKMSHLTKLVEKHNPAVIISLLPYIYHVQAAEVALLYRKHFCTTSYVSEAMQALDAKAKELDLCFINECGVDPGLDHMSVMKVIHSLPSTSKLIEFRSTCGGLPSPEANNNPFGYKFSWSPRGVLLASNNSAVVLRNGEKVFVPGSELFSPENVFKDTIDGLGELEWYYNRDSVAYLDIYGIKDTRSIARGTYRYIGWAKTMQTIKILGFTSTEPFSSSLQSNALAYCNAVIGNKGHDPSQHIISQIPFDIQTDVLPRLHWLGLFDDSLQVPVSNCPIDFFTFLLHRKLSYKTDEKDMIAMQHVFEVEHSPSHRERWTSALIDFGLQPDGYSSMARTVSLPLAIAVRNLLEGKIALRGVLRPVDPEVYLPVLSEMEMMGIAFEEKVCPVLLWLRAEVKKGEERVAVVPRDVEKLIRHGFTVKVERCENRSFSDSQYEAVGAEMVENGSWVTAPHSAIIIGLKELPETNPTLLSHRHLYFAHCFKDQQGWKELLQRFVDGKGFLWDLEFLRFSDGRRVAAFGRAAGIVGCALGVIAWARRRLGEEMGPLRSWKSSKDLVDCLLSILSKVGCKPSILVLGALGRCGGGASWLAEQIGVQSVKWDLEETKAGGPFGHLMEYDILVNCIYLSHEIPAFLTLPMLSTSSRKLTTFVDVSCDPVNPNNPFPLYDRLTTLSDPVLTVDVDGGSALDVIAIDHLPTLIPSESSVEFSEALLPHLMEIGNSDVWTGAERLFFDKCNQLQ